MKKLCLILVAISLIPSASWAELKINEPVYFYSDKKVTDRGARENFDGSGGYLPSVAGAAAANATWKSMAANNTLGTIFMVANTTAAFFVVGFAVAHMLNPRHLTRRVHLTNYGKIDENNLAQDQRDCYLEQQRAASVLALDPEVQQLMALNGVQSLTPAFISLNREIVTGYDANKKEFKIKRPSHFRHLAYELLNSKILSIQNLPAPLLSRKISKDNASAGDGSMFFMSYYLAPARNQTEGTCVVPTKEDILKLL